MVSLTEVPTTGLSLNSFLGTTEAPVTKITIRIPICRKDKAVCSKWDAFPILRRKEEIDRTNRYRIRFGSWEVKEISLQGLNIFLQPPAASKFKLFLSCKDGIWLMNRAIVESLFPRLSEMVWSEMLTMDYILVSVRPGFWCSNELL